MSVDAVTAAQPYLHSALQLALNRLYFILTAEWVAPDIHFAPLTFLCHLSIMSSLISCNCHWCSVRQRGNQFADTSIRARASIAELGARFIRPGCVLLTHGMSRVVLALLQRAVASVGVQLLQV